MKLTVHGLYAWSMVAIFCVSILLDAFSNVDKREIYGVALAVIFSDMIIYGTYLVIHGDDNK